MAALVPYFFLIFCSRTAQYVVHLYQYLKEWCRSPRWSISCCLEVLLPLSDMQGGVSALAETNVLDKQLQSGQLEMPTIFAVVKESDPYFFTHEEVGQGGKTTSALQNRYHNHVVCNTETCHQETQTNLFAFFTADSVVRKPKLEI